MNKSIKKTLMLLLVLVMSISLFACAPKPAEKAQEPAETEKKTEAQETVKEDEKEDETLLEEPKTVEIETMGKKVEVPINPTRVASIELSAIDTIDAFGKGGTIVGMPKATGVKYLAKYFDNEKVANLGSLKETDMELLHSLKPELIIIGRRQQKQYDEYAKIAPTILISVDQKKGYMNSFRNNVETLAKVFDSEDKANEYLTKYDERIAKLKEAANGQDVLVTIATKNNLNVLGPNSRGSIISNEVGFNNMGDVDSTHGDNVSFEFIVEKNPVYLFVLDRDTAINAKGSKTAQEIIENELIQGIDAYKNNKIVYLTPDVWYLAEGGISSTDIMLKDLENGILK